MRSAILMSCLSLSIISFSQSGNRVRSGTPLRWSMNGSIEIMEGDLSQYYGSTDSNKVYTLTSTYASATLGNPHATRFASAQASCDQNSVQFNWTAIQQFNADRYDIEQSSDGRHWTLAGTVPANRTDFGQANYGFNYTKNASDVVFRINAVSKTGEQVYSAIIQSPCSNTSYLSATPNPVYSTTTLRIGSPVVTKVRLLLTNSSGVVMQSRDESLVTGTNNVSIDMSSLPSGYYTLFIQWQAGKQNSLNLIKR